MRGAGRARRGGKAAVALALAWACGGPAADSRATSEPGEAGGNQAVPVLDAVTDTSGFVVVGESRIAYTALGSGPLLVMIHGGPGLDQQYMRPWLDEVADFARGVYYDQRGTGGSTGPLDESEVSFDALVSDIDALRVAMGRDRMVLLGHSWGGILAAAHALRRPGTLAGLILMSTAEPGTRFAALTARNQQDSRSPEDAVRIREVTESPEFGDGDPTAVSELYRLAFRGTLADPADLSLLNLDLSPRTAKNGAEVMRLLGATMEPQDYWDELAGLSVPTLVIHGRHDPLPVEMAEELAETIPDAEVLVLRDAGHFPFAEAPQEVLAAIRRFVEAR